MCVFPKVLLRFLMKRMSALLLRFDPSRCPNLELFGSQNRQNRTPKTASKRCRFWNPFFVTFWADLGPFSAPFGDPKCIPNRSPSLLGVSGRTLGVSWAHPGLNLEPLGSPRGNFETILAHLATMLAPAGVILV